MLENPNRSVISIGGGLSSSFISQLNNLNNQESDSQDVLHQLDEINKWIAKQKDRKQFYGASGVDSTYSILYDQTHVPSSQSKKVLDYSGGGAHGGGSALMRSQTMLGRASFATFAASAEFTRENSIMSHHRDHFERVLDQQLPDDFNTGIQNEGGSAIRKSISGLSEQKRKSHGEHGKINGAASEKGSHAHTHSHEHKSQRSKDPEQLHWNTLRKWKNQHVKFSKITDQVKRYEFTEKDENGYFGSVIKHLKNFDKVPMHKFHINDNAQFHIMGHFQQNMDTGERYLRFAMREWYEEKKEDEEEIKRIGDGDQSMQEQSGKRKSILTENNLMKNIGKEFQHQFNHQMIRAEVHSIVFFKLLDKFDPDDPDDQPIEYQGSVLYDISNDHLDIMSGGFDNDFFICKNHETFFFRKEQSFEDGQLKRYFQLYKHSMRSEFIPFYQDYQSNDDTPPLQKLDQYRIEIPADFEDIDDVQISFLKQANEIDTLKEDQGSAEERFLSSKYVMIKRKHKKYSDRYSKLLVYGLKDLSQPLFKYNKKQFLAIQCGFFMKNSQRGSEPNIFIIKGFNIDYKIEYNGKNSQVLTETKAREIDEFRRSKMHQCEPRFLQITLERTGESFGQYFFFNFTNGDVQLIYPFHSNKMQFIATGIYSKKQEVDEFIRRHYFKDQKKGPIITIEGDTGNVLTDKLHKYIFHEECNEHEDHTKNFVQESTDRYFTYRDLIVRINLEQPDIHIWSVKTDSEQSKMKEILDEIELFANSNHLSSENLLYQMLSQFKTDYHPKIYQNNYDSDLMWNNGQIENQYLQCKYLHKSKYQVFMGHNSITVGKKDFEIDQQYLLLDLDDDNNQLCVIKLFDRQMIPDVKLVRYHVSLRSQCVLFFFHQRNKSKNSGLYNNTRQMSGVHFFVLKNIPELLRIAVKKDQFTHVPLLSQYTSVYVFKDLQHIIRIKNYSQKEVAKYQDNAKLTSLSAYNMVFEMIHDFQNPVDQFVPFIFTNRVSSVDEPRFESYFVLFSIRDFVIENHKMEFKHRKNLRKFLSVQKLNQYRGMDEIPNFPKSYKEFNMNNQTHGCPLFTRSSNFEKNLYHRTQAEIDDSDQYSAKFQVGFHHQIDDVKFFEFQELLVTFDSLEKPFHNKDQIIFHDGMEEFDFNCPMTAIPIGLRHAIPSMSFQDKIINRGMENNRLVPIIEDNGIIHGAYCLINTYTLARQNLTVTNSKDVVEQICKQKELKEFILARLGEEVQILENLGKQCRICFRNGIIRKLDINLLGIHENQRNATDPRFHYEMFPLQDRRDDIDVQYQHKGQIKLQTPLMLIGYKHYQIYGQINNTITLSTSIFKKNIIERKLFDRIEMLYELYDSQKKNLVSSMPSFHEIYKTNHSQKKNCYFQFRYIMRGRNFCNMDFVSFKNSILKFKQVLDMKEDQIDKLKLVENSALEILTRSVQKSANIHKSKDLINTCFEMLGLNRFNDFQCNLNYESFIQKGLDNRFTNPIFFMMNYLLNKFNDHRFVDVIMSDLPQLLSQDKITIDEYLNLSQIELEENEGIEDEYSQRRFCNMEQKLVNPLLPILGEKTQRSRVMHDFQNIFNINEEIEQELIVDEDDDNETHDELLLHKSHQNQFTQNWNSLVSRYGDVQNKQSMIEHEGAHGKQDGQSKHVHDNDEDEIEDNSQQVEVEHFFISFFPMIRKIKIDKLMKRHSSKKQHTEYLSLIKVPPEDFDEIDDLFLADLLFKQEKYKKFFNNTTAQKLIDRQYVVTRRLMRNLLILYICGFMIPFVYNIFVSNNRYASSQDDEDPKNIQVVTTATVLRYCVAFSVQLFFLSLEYAELSHNGVAEYFQDPFNFVDSSQMVIYVAQVWIQLSRGSQMFEHDNARLWGNFLTITCLFMSSIKLMQFLRYNEDFGFLIQMILTVFVDLFPFITFFAVTVFFFSLVMVIMDTGFDDGDYPDVSRFLIIFLQNFRIAVGDLGPISYNSWDKADETLRGEAITIIWFFWVLNVFIMVIVMLNFLIAEVSQTYDKVKSQGKQLVYQKKAELNLLTCKIYKMFGRITSFKVIIFTGPKNNEDQDGNESGLGFSAQIRQDTQDQIYRVKQDIIKGQKKILGLAKQQQTNIEAGIKAQKIHLDNSFNNLEKKINHFSKSEQGQLKQIIQDMVEEMNIQNQHIKALTQQMNELQSGIVDDNAAISDDLSPVEQDFLSLPTSTQKFPLSNSQLIKRTDKAKFGGSTSLRRGSLVKGGLQRSQRITTNKSAKSLSTSQISYKDNVESDSDY